MKHLILILFLVLLNADLFAQAPDTLWTKTFGGSGSDGGNSVQQTSDGGYIITGYTESFGAGGTDVWLIKTDTDGDTLWTKTFGGTNGDKGFSVQQTSDSGYIITGETRSFGAGGTDVWLIKTDANGDTLWTKTFGGSGINEAGISVQQTTDGGYIITGVGNSNIDLLLIKTNASGDTQWTKTFGGDRIDVGNSVQQTSDGGYIITGVIGFFPLPPVFPGDIWLLKTNASGDTLWTRNFGISYHLGGTSVQQTSDGGYIITGRNFRLIKTKTNGDILWTKTFGESGNDICYSVQQTSDGGYIITGYTVSLGADYADVRLIKTDANGDTLWTKTFGGYFGDGGKSVKQTSDGGYIITGFTNAFGADNQDVWLIRIAPDVTAIDETPKAFINDYRMQQNYPNPFNPSTKITYTIPELSLVTLKVYDVLGSEIVRLVNEERPAGTYEITWYAEGLPSGVYFYQLKTERFVETKKMILIK